MLYIIRQREISDNPDDAFSMIVRASSAEEARRIAQENEDESDRPNRLDWISPQSARCSEINPDGPSEVIMVC